MKDSPSFRPFEGVFFMIGRVGCRRSSDDSIQDRLGSRPSGSSGPTPMNFLEVLPDRVFGVARKGGPEGRPARVG
jgi:hypothetical protein